MVQSQKRILQWICGFQKYTSAEVSLISNRQEMGYRRNQNVGVKSEWDMGACMSGPWGSENCSCSWTYTSDTKTTGGVDPASIVNTVHPLLCICRFQPRVDEKIYILEGSKMQTLNLPLPSNYVLIHRTYIVFTRIDTLLHIVSKLEMTEFIWEVLPRLCESTTPFEALDHLRILVSLGALKPVSWGYQGRTDYTVNLGVLSKFSLLILAWVVQFC